jgi:hypothetical protein
MRLGQGQAQPVSKHRTKLLPMGIINTNPNLHVNPCTWNTDLVEKATEAKKTMEWV